MNRIIATLLISSLLSPIAPADQGTAIPALYPQQTGSLAPVASKDLLTYTFNIPFTSSSGIATYCGSSTARCNCQIAYTENSIQQRQLAPATLGSNSTVVSCPFSNTVYHGIPAGVTASLSVVPTYDSTRKFSFPAPLVVSPDANDSLASLRDFTIAGIPFQDIAHTSCERSFPKGEVNSAVENWPSVKRVDGSDGIRMPLANYFCVRTGLGSTISGDKSGNYCINGLSDLRDPAKSIQEISSSAPHQIISHSARKYFVDLFYPKNVTDEFNFAGNTFYKCDSRTPAGGSVPQDRTFALAVYPGGKATIGVESYITPSRKDSTSSLQKHMRCGTGGPVAVEGATMDNASLTVGCLGYAYAPEVDGSCPVIQDRTNGTVTPIETYPLRRYVSLLPTAFDANGYPINENQSKNVIYVLDRPALARVTGSSSSGTRISIEGPKPCPYSWRYDPEGTNGNSANHVATFKNDWDYRNPDALFFPNFDAPATSNGTSSTPGSCSAAIPFPLARDATGNRLPSFSMITTQRNANPYGVAERSDTVTESGNRVNPASLTPNPILNPIYGFKKIPVRRYHPWAPHYVLDESFAACAPRASAKNYVDPTLVVAKVSQDYTDHGMGGVAWCAKWYPDTPMNSDVSVKSAVTAPQLDIAAFLQTDRSYGCTMNRHPAAARSGIQTPSRGCQMASGSGTASTLEPPASADRFATTPASVLVPPTAVANSCASQNNQALPCTMPNPVVDYY